MVDPSKQIIADERKIRIGHLGICKLEIEEIFSDDKWNRKLEINQTAPNRCVHMLIVSLCSVKMEKNASEKSCPYLYPVLMNSLSAMKW